MKDKIIGFKEALEQYKLSAATEADFTKQFIRRGCAVDLLFKELPKLTVAQRKEVGLQLNALKEAAKTKYADYLAKKKPTKQAKTLDEDLSLPPTAPQIGSIHPLTLIEEKAINILEKIGFKVVEGPEIEDEWHNFTALNLPPGHPAREMQDTFFIKQPEGEKKMVLRTHTSSVQVRIMEKKKPPIRVVSVGRVFRNETISARSHCVFHQLEGLYVNKEVSFVDLKEVLYYFIHRLFGSEIPIRLRPSYFPFTEPSAEVDIACLLCRNTGCNLCKQSGWVEIAGAGMVDPHVLENCDIDPTMYTGFAFGVGLERLVMLLNEVPDVRLFTENDLRFLAQFSYNPC